MDPRAVILLLGTGAMGALTVRRVILAEWLPALVDAVVLALLAAVSWLFIKRHEGK